MEAERGFSSSPEGEPTLSRRNALRLPFASPQREFPHDCSEADERSHFFYLLILIRDCLERSLFCPPSSWLLRLLPPRGWLAGWLALPYVVRPLFPALSSRLTVLINRASCTMQQVAATAAHSVVSLFPVPFQKTRISNECTSVQCTFVGIARAVLSVLSLRTPRVVRLFSREVLRDCVSSLLTFPPSSWCPLII